MFQESVFSVKCAQFEHGVQKEYSTVQTKLYCDHGDLRWKNDHWSRVFTRISSPTSSIYLFHKIGLCVCFINWKVALGHLPYADCSFILRVTAEFHTKIYVIQLMCDCANNQSPFSGPHIFQTSLCNERNGSAIKRPTGRPVVSRAKKPSGQRNSLFLFPCVQYSGTLRFGSTKLNGGNFMSIF